MGALGDIYGIVTDQMRRGDVSDLADQLNSGAIQPQQVYSKLAALTGDRQDMQNAMVQGTINGAQGMNPNGTPLVRDADADPSLPWSAGAPVQKANIPDFETSLGQNTANPQAYLQGRQGQIVTGALSKLPPGTDPMQAMVGGAQALYAATGDATPLKSLNEWVMNQMKAQAGINKDNAEAGLATANTKKAVADTAHTQSETTTAPGGAPITSGQKDLDKEFSTTWNNYNTTGGATTLNNANQIIGNTIQKLQDGTLTTGRLADRMAVDNDGHPTYTGKALDPSVLNAKNDVDAAVLPLLKPLFGARVTNFDAQAALSSMGINPMKSPQDNIAQLQRLQARLQSGQNDLAASGQYFDKNGTLAGYQNSSSPSAQAAAGGGSPQGGAPASTAAPAKVASEADIQQTMAQGGFSRQQVLDRLKEKGWTVK